MSPSIGVETPMVTKYLHTYYIKHSTFIIYGHSMALLDPCMGFHPVDGWRNQIFIVGLLIKGFLPHVRKLKLIPQSTNKTPTPPTGSTETSLISCIAKSEDLTDDISTPAGVILFLWSPFTHQPRCNQCGKETDTVFHQ
jgi:hypothetical protein